MRPDGPTEDARVDVSRSLPPEWPEAVRPPGAPDWERSAVGWLFDQCPADYRAHEVLRRHPRVLARFAAINLDAALTAAEQGLRTARVDFAGLPPQTVEAAVAAWDRERDRLRTARRSVDAVGRALAGEVYVPRL